AALDVDPAVATRGAGVRGDGIQFLLALVEELGQCLQPLGALLEIQLEQVGHADLARMFDRLRKVDLLGVRAGHGLAVDGAAQLLRGLAADPLAADVTLQDIHLSYLSSNDSTTRSVIGCAWHVRTKPLATSFLSSAKLSSMRTSPSITFARQVPLTLDVHENGTSSPAAEAQSRMLGWSLSKVISRFRP